MKNFMIAGLLLVGALTITGCKTINDKTKTDDSTKLPGSDRMWYFQNFNNRDETIYFLHNLYNSGSNGQFSIGISDFESKNKFEECTICFSGHINSHFGNDLDIYNSVYDDFWIDFVYSRSENKIISEYVKITYIPFSYNEKNNDKVINYKLEDFSEKKNILFFYNDELIMCAALFNTNYLINQENLISNLIANFKVYGKGENL